MDHCSNCEEKCYNQFSLFRLSIIEYNRVAIVIIYTILCHRSHWPTCNPIAESYFSAGYLSIFCTVSKAEKGLRANLPYDSKLSDDLGHVCAGGYVSGHTIL